jgi:hypothetical protein
MCAGKNLLLPVTFLKNVSETHKMSDDVLSFMEQTQDVNMSDLPLNYIPRVFTISRCLKAKYFNNCLVL